VPKGYGFADFLLSAGVNNRGTEMKAVNLVVLVKIKGKRKNPSPEQAKTLGLSATLMFFLYAGCREREVMFACWNEISFQKPYTFTV
jgi:hypothetical protein